MISFFQTGPRPIELKQLPRKVSPVSLTPSNKGTTQLYNLYDVPNRSPLYNDSEQLHINAVAQELQHLALHPHSERETNLWVYSVRQTI